MSDKKKLLVAFKVEGDVAKLVYSSHPDAAENSEVDAPEEGMAVLFQDDGSVAELNDCLIEGLKLINADVIKEFAVNTDNLEEAVKQATRAVVLLGTYLDLARRDENEDDAE